MRTLSKAYPEYVKNCVSFYTTVNPYMDLHCVLDFFKANDIINDKMILYNSVVSQNLKEELSYKACIPGILRLFVRCDGKFFPCERVNENLAYYNIGSIESGFDLERMRELLIVGKLTEDECKTCWNLRQCNMCSNEIDLHGGEQPMREDKLTACQNKRRQTEFDLYEQSVLGEFGYQIPVEEM